MSLKEKLAQLEAEQVSRQQFLQAEINQLNARIKQEQQQLQNMVIQAREELTHRQGGIDYLKDLLAAEEEE